jgi:hypothetical protein
VLVDVMDDDVVDFDDVVIDDVVVKLVVVLVSEVPQLSRQVGPVDHPQKIRGPDCGVSKGFKR